MKIIPYGKQDIRQEDIDAVAEVLKSDYLTQGPEIERFEKSFADFVGSKYAVAVANGTAALHLCALALNVDHQSKVITSPITFAASANCIRFCGGEVVFADIDPRTYLLDIEKVRELLESSPKGTYDGIIPVDFAGRPINLEQFRKLADEFDLWIVEDACHAPGGYFVDSSAQANHCGNGSYADVAIFSFHPVKHIAAGEGGMITTNDPEIFDKLLKLRSHGITRNHAEYSNPIGLAIGTADEADDQYPAWYMEMQELGYNYRLTDIQCALGLSQLNRAEEGLTRRREIANKYEIAFSGHPFIRGQSGAIEGHAYHLYVIEVDRRLELYNFLRGHKIFCQIHYVPCHLMPYYQQFGWREGDLPNAETYYSRCLSLPMFPSLSDEDLDFVIDKIFEFYNG